MLLAATDIGIYKLDSASTNWILYSQGLPNVITTDIEFNLSLNKIYVSTFGRGIWETDLTTLTGVNPNQNSISKIKVYPTINDGNFSIDLRDVANEKIQMTVIDALGKSVFEESISGSRINTIQLNLNKGLYYIKLQGKVYLGSTTVIIK
jgi:hypothetical protein